jgi:hypothetical protein
MPVDELRDAVRATLLEMLETASSPEALLSRLEREAEHWATALAPNASAAQVLEVLASVITEIRDDEAKRKPH